MDSERKWVLLISGLTLGTLLGVVLYPRLFPPGKNKVADPRIDRIRSLIDEAEELLKKTRKKK